MVALAKIVDRAWLEVLRRFRQTKDPNFIGFDKYAKHGAYHWNELQHNGDYRSKAEFVRGYTKPGDRLLDLGCGDGAYLFQLRNDARRLVGIDADFDAVRLARANLENQAVDRVRVLQLPLSEVNRESIAEPEGCEVVYSMDVIEHLPQPEELLEAASRTVAPGGVIIIGTPLFIRPELVSPYHVKEFTREEISQVVSSRLQIESEQVLAEKRMDGETYQAFYIAVARGTS